jgi:prepilin-type N-terminal cleavage/methylation domain-containing protein
MKKESLQYKNGLTLIEVMISMVVILIVAMGAVSYMYASMKHAREADVRITATRLGQLCLDGWKITGEIINKVWDVAAFDPTNDEFDSNLLPAASDITTTSSGIPGVGTELGRYTITVDGAKYYITLSYLDEYSANTKKLYRLNACVAWNRNYSSSALESNPRNVWLTSYSIY